MPKLIIHETDPHGCGNIYFNGKFDRYTYDDGSWGDVRATVQELINIGFINAEDVVMFEGGSDIYEFVEKGLSVNE